MIHTKYILINVYFIVFFLCCVIFLEENHRVHKAHQDDNSSVSKKAAYSNICKTVQAKLRDMQDSWLRRKTEEIHSLADRKDMKKFHDVLKTIYGPKSLEPPHCSVQMEALFSQIKILS